VNLPRKEDTNADEDIELLRVDEAQMQITERAAEVRATLSNSHGRDAHFSLYISETALNIYGRE
jgi:hypothetical protein